MPAVSKINKITNKINKNKRNKKKFYCSRRQKVQKTKYSPPGQKHKIQKGKSRAEAHKEDKQDKQTNNTEETELCDSETK